MSKKLTLAVSAVTTSQFKINASATESCTEWKYRIIGLKEWTAFTSATGEDVEETVTGIAENTAYGVEVRAKLGDDVLYSPVVRMVTPKNTTGPTITAIISNVTEDSFTISGYSNYECDNWTCVIDGGGEFFPPGKGVARTLTVKGLEQNTQYAIKLSARRTYNQVIGESSTITINTLGTSKLENVSADIPEGEITLTWTVYADGYTHLLKIKDGKKVILSIPDITGDSATSEAKVVELTPAQKLTLLEYVAQRRSIETVFELQTFKNDYSVGISSKNVILEVVSGSMHTSVYDKNLNEVIDLAERVQKVVWKEITDAPIPITTTDLVDDDTNGRLISGAFINTIKPSAITTEDFTSEEGGLPSNDPKTISAEFLEDYVPKYTVLSPEDVLVEDDTPKLISGKALADALVFADQVEDTNSDNYGKVYRLFILDGEIQLEDVTAESSNSGE